ncbi:MAG: hypothetical protein P8Y26_14475 [Gemmatimonadales bacterium]
MSLQRRLGGGGAIVQLADRSRQGVEVNLLVLERMDELVNEDGLQLVFGNIFDHVQGVATRIVVADHLLEEERTEQGSELKRVGQQAEASVDGRHGSGLLIRQLLHQGAGEEALQALPRARSERGRRRGPDAAALLDAREQLRRQAGQGGVRAGAPDRAIGS